VRVSLSHATTRIGFIQQTWPALLLSRYQRPINYLHTPLPRSAEAN
jgi:hypothetical protein